MKSSVFAAVLLVATGLARADAAPPVLLLLPFTQIDHTAGAGWVGEAVQRSLQADLSRSASAQIQLPAQTVSKLVTDDPAAVAHFAHEASADYLVSGQFQIIDEQIRLTGQLLDGHSGRPIGSLKATGAFKSLFGMEDALADQIQRRLRTAAAPARALTSATPVVEDSGLLLMAVRRPAPVGTVEVRYASRAAEIGRDRHIYMIPFAYGYGGYGYCGYAIPYFSGFVGGGASFGFATGGTGTLAY